MSFYDQQPSWSGPGRQSSWEQQAPPPRSGSVSAMSPLPADSGAFSSQFEEIDRATDNLTKGGKWFPGSMGSPAASAPPSRRESGPAMGRGYDSYGGSGGGGGGGSSSSGGGDARMGHTPSRNSSVSEYDGGRSGSASGLQGFYQGQRFPPRQSEAEQMLQAKRRMAAQRERELRNYHQEQQYNRNVSGVKSDRAMSPNTMSEEDRRELIARQHRALYGDNSNLYGSESSSSPVRRQSQDVRVPSSSGARGGSPLAFDPFGVPSTSSNGEGGAPVQMPPRDREPSTTSPATTGNLITEQQQQTTRTSTSSPTSGGSPPLTQKGNVAPIGTRPAPGQTTQGGLNKRSTTPMTPSSLSYGFSSSDAAQAQQQQAKQDEQRSSVSAASPNPAIAAEGKSNMPGLGSWGGNSGGWGQGGKTLGVQASVWG